VLVAFAGRLVREPLACFTVRTPGTLSLPTARNQSARFGELLIGGAPSGGAILVTVWSFFAALGPGRRLARSSAGPGPRRGDGRPPIPASGGPASGSVSPGIWGLLRAPARGP